jgi:hypothetical protein
VVFAKKCVRHEQYRDFDALWALVAKKMRDVLVTDVIIIYVCRFVRLKFNVVCGLVVD